MTPKEKIVDKVHTVKYLARIVNSFVFCLEQYTKDCVTPEMEPIQAMIGTMQARTESLREYIKKLEDDCNEL